MEKKSTRRKLLRRKYKRYAAAVAGAAIISGAALHGIPAAKAHAAENPTNAPPTNAKQTMTSDANQSLKQLMSERYHVRDRGDKEDWHNGYRHRSHERYHGEDRYVSRQGDVVVRYLDSPVDTIKNHAAELGFDAANDTFTFLSLSSHEASILVTKHDTGERFRVELERGRHNWHIVTVSSY